ncbi:ethyl acetate hydrolase-like [Ptychodera flava]|uniref:ethyl acetate hydrolase-like n=1 Tax=Ptychodera flava TaxID=63121 RepID=UPI00396A9C75
MHRLSEESERFLQLREQAIRSGLSKPYNELSVDEARAASLKTAKTFGGDFEFVGHIRDMVVPVQHLEEGVPVRIYKPAALPHNPAVWIYFHGGGDVVGSRDTVDTLCRTISSQGPFLIVNVGYRLAPEHPGPAYAEDAINVTKWVLQNKVSIGAGARSIVGVGGDSHGGNISTILCHEVKGLDYQVLIYPAVDLTQSYPSHTEFREGFILDQTLVEWFMNLSFRTVEDRKGSFVSCIWRDDSSFVGQPPCLIIVTECDPLRDEGLAYAEKLKSAGVPVEVLLMEGTVHAYFHLPGLFKESCRRSYDKVVEFIRSRTPTTPE